jgi:alpha-glucan,water dikinase
MTIIESKEQNISKQLASCRKTMMELKFVENDDTKKLKSRLISFGVNPNDINGAFNSIKGVWASKFNERAFLATKKVGINLDDIRMAVLVQKIIPADYSYVIHTKNPSTNDDNELYAEVVIGMGETLVGTYEGQSFSFTHNKSKIKN